MLIGWALVPSSAPVPEHTFDARGTAAVSPAPAAGARAPQVTPPVLVPVAVTIPDLGVDAPVTPETVSGGELVIPGDPRILGYWHGALGRGGAVGEELPERGTLVLAGHVDVEGDLGALHDLVEVEPGTVVIVRDEDGHEERWLIDALEVRHKEDLPEFPADGPRRLALVTCGGPVVAGPGGRSYRDNVIAWAAPEPGPVDTAPHPGRSGRSGA